MLNMTLIGRVASEMKVKTDKKGQPYAILEVTVDRCYRNPDGTRTQDTVPVKLFGSQVNRFQKVGYPGCRIAVYGTFETSPYEDINPNRSFLLKARQVEYLSFRKQEPDNDNCSSEESQDDAT